MLVGCCMSIAQLYRRDIDQLGRVLMFGPLVLFKKRNMCTILFLSSVTVIYSWKQL